MGTTALDAAIDLGTSRLRVHVRGRGLVQDAEISAAAAAPAEVHDIVAPAIGRLHRSGRRPSTLAVVSSGSTDVQRRALAEGMRRAGAGQVALIESPVAGALGTGFDFAPGEALLLVDVGASTSDVAVVSGSGVCRVAVVPVGGGLFDAALADHLRVRHRLEIGPGAAEDVKIEVGGVVRSAGGSVDVVGRDVASGLPRTVRIGVSEIGVAYEAVLARLVDAVGGVVAGIPGALARTVREHGMVLVGGGALLRGLADRLSRETGLDAVVPTDAGTCGVRGAGVIVDSPERWRPLVIPGPEARSSGGAIGRRLLSRLPRP